MSFSHQKGDCNHSQQQRNQQQQPSQEQGRTHTHGQQQQVTEEKSQRQYPQQELPLHHPGPYQRQNQPLQGQQYGDLTLQETVQLHPQQQPQGFDDLLWDGKTFMFH